MLRWYINLEYAKHSGFIIKLCRPYRAKTKGKVERFNGYLRRSFYVPLTSRFAQGGLKLDVVTANVEVAHWLANVANERMHGTTEAKPSIRLKEEQPYLQAIAAPWRGQIAAARPQQGQPSTVVAERPAAVIAHLEQAIPTQHTLAVYEQLLNQAMQGVVV